MGGDAVLEAGEARASPDDGSADPVVRDGDEQCPVLPDRAHRHTGRGRVANGVRERLAGDEVRGGLDAGLDALGWHVDVDRDRRRARQVGERGRQAVVQPRRPNTSGDLAEVADRFSDLLDDAIESGGEDRGTAWERPLQPAHLDAERHEALLRAVVEISLETASLLVARFDDPDARRLDLGEL